MLEQKLQDSRTIDRFLNPKINERQKSVMAIRKENKQRMIQMSEDESKSGERLSEELKEPQDKNRRSLRPIRLKPDPQLKSARVAAHFKRDNKRFEPI